MSRPQTFRTAPAVGYSLVKDGDDRTPTNVVIYHGYQANHPRGLYLNMADLDSHKAGQDAYAAKRAFEQQFPNIAAKIFWVKTKRGWHGYFYSNKQFPHGRIIYAGQHIGEMISADHEISIPPDDLAPGWLSATEYDLILQFWTIQGAASGGGNWRASHRRRQARWPLHSASHQKGYAPRVPANPLWRRWQKP